MYFKYAAAALTAVLPLCSAQTWSKCNPLEKTCPSNKGLAASTYTADFTSDSALDQWKVTAGKVPLGPQGAEFAVAKKGDSPTIDTDFYFFFGKAEVVMKAAPGTGVVSSIVLESDDLDEIDWEVLGGDTTQVQTNYFGKGDTTTYDRGTYVPVATPQETFHTYTIDWTKDAVTWSINGAVVRTLTSNDAKGGTRFPQTPMRLRLGTWAGGDPSNPKGTIEWAGGLTDYGAGPYTMYVKSVRIENANPAESYTYSDNTGSWQSIKFDGAVDTSPSPSVTSTTSTASSTSTKSPSTSTLATSTKATPPLLEPPLALTRAPALLLARDPPPPVVAAAAAAAATPAPALALAPPRAPEPPSPPSSPRAPPAPSRVRSQPAPWCSARSLPCWHSKHKMTLLV
ncbi:glycoside hydrolase family 16 protein [Aspergillus novofumigatus IBT 16806]|uniref:chitinase n=1 Tax=Aspergillus novofumigatus (strain IBT 16806) TaxID=1392255 RepID=A0A2I1C7V4_ASPN1|nr:concanavalin A-like lectin/glucanase [Aspergillus novofumigatus IBT 16806]PKX93712.1 concanavalin A-like lectin/glucanase [Aspergillus novofumigatus IBT 16806]